jgi:1-propanol dehydrogenase
MEEFSCKTRVVSGSGTIRVLRRLEKKRLLLVADPYFVKTGKAKLVAEASGCPEVEIFDRVEPDPSVELAAEGTARVKEFRPDLLVALGGGSAMDLAKAMAYFGKGEYTLAAIPTTSGSGSEVTDFSILTHGTVKHPLIDGRMQPDVAILAQELLEKLPPSLVADGGFDVLSHAAESFVAKGADPMTRALAGNAFSAAFAHLPASYRGDVSVRGKIHLASTMAGLAFSQSGLGLCHAMSHSLGGVFHIPHGRLNGILLPEVIACNTACAGKQYAKLSRMAGLGGSADTIGVRNLRNGLIRLRKELNLPATLKEAGVPPQKLWHHSKEIVEAALKDPCLGTNPGQVEAFQIRRILEAVSGRG